MRKVTTLLGALLLIFTIVLLNSCKKQTTPDESGIVSNSEMIMKVNSWLDLQKSKKQPNKAANIDLLKVNLDFSKLEIEKSNDQEQLIVIPINENFKTVKKIDKKLIPTLVLLMNSSGNIRKGNIVLYEPENDKLERVPSKAFYDIFNTATPDNNGKYQFLSVTGWFQYELTYKNNRLSSAGIVTPKENLPNADHTARTEVECIEWYLVTTYYVDGEIVGQTVEFIGRSCYGCDDPYLQGHCPDDGSVGTPDYQFEEEYVRRGDWTQNVYSIATADGGGWCSTLQSLTARFHRVHTENDRITSCYLVRSDVNDNSAGATSSISTYYLSSWTNTSLAVATAGQLHWPDDSHLSFTSSYFIRMGDIYWHN